MLGTGIPAVSSCGLQVLVLTAQMGTIEVKTIGGWGSRGRETVKQKCRELVYQWFPLWSSSAVNDSSESYTPAVLPTN
jgi:hypothetical protein